MTNHTLSWVGPLSLGATIMYLFDPVGGRRRRALLRDQAVSVARRTADASSAVACDLENRVTGLRARVKHIRDDRPVDDGVIEARVRSQLGRVSTHPGAIGVSSVDGVVTIDGPVLAHEHNRIVKSLRRVRGAVDVIDRTTQHETANSIPALQGEGSLPESSWLSGNWSPTARLLGVVGGAGLIAYGLQQRNVTGGIAATIGAGLLSRSLTDVDLADRVSELLDMIRHIGETRTIDVSAGERGMPGPSAG